MSDSHDDRNGPAESTLMGQSAEGSQAEVVGEASETVEVPASAMSRPTSPVSAVGAERDDAPFNPLVNESDMFKVLIGVVIVAAILVALVLAGRAVL